MNDQNRHKDKERQHTNVLTNTAPPTSNEAVHNHQDDHLTGGQSARPSVGIDVDYYQSAIDDPEVSEERKRELIELIGALVINFIDIGFGVHPVQLAQNEGRSRLGEETPPLHTQFDQERIEKETLPERSDA